MRPDPMIALALAGLALTACGDEPAANTTASPTTDAADDGAVIDPGDGGDYTVELDPASFGGPVDNPLLPMLAGARWVYHETSPDGEIEVITVEVLGETRSVDGVEATVVHDSVETEDGELVEDTYDWYAQDSEGNVWYFGEDTTAYEDGSVSEEGAWEAGVDGALPGIVMPAAPAASDVGYRQEYLAGEAEDMGQVIAVAGGAVVTRDWTPLEPDVIEEKTYASGVGLVHEATTAGEDAGTEAVLVEFTAGAQSTVE